MLRSARPPEALGHAPGELLARQHGGPSPPPGGPREHPSPWPSSPMSGGPPTAHPATLRAHTPAVLGPRPLVCLSRTPARDPQPRPRPNPHRPPHPSRARTTPARVLHPPRPRRSPTSPRPHLPSTGSIGTASRPPPLRMPRTCSTARASSSTSSSTPSSPPETRPPLRLWPRSSAPSPRLHRCRPQRPHRHQRHLRPP